MKIESFFVYVNFFNFYLSILKISINLKFYFIYEKLPKAKSQKPNLN